MKKIALLLSVFILFLATPLYALAAPKQLVYVNQKNQSFLPIRFLNGFDGITVNYTAPENKVEISQEGRKLTLYIGQKIAYVNGQKVPMTIIPFRHNGETYVPLQFISKELNLAVKWQNVTSSIQISHGKASVILPVLTGHLIESNTSPVTATSKTFKVGNHSYRTQLVTVSLLHPKVSLDVVLAGGSIGKVENLNSLAKRSHAFVAINGTFFDAYTAGAFKQPYGFIARAGVIKQRTSDERATFAFDANNLTTIRPGTSMLERFEQDSLQGAVEAGPRLITNGQITVNPKQEGFRDPKIMTGGGARSAIGLTRDHKLLMLTTGGATIPQLAQIMKQAGAYQAMNLDGGASSGLFYNGKYLTNPGRLISNALIVKLQ